MATKEDAMKYLRDAAPEQCFWINNGPILKNLFELGEALPNLNDETYNHHVSKEKNDFSRWINDVIGDQQLANELLSSKNKESSVKKIRNRLNSLKKKAG